MRRIELIKNYFGYEKGTIIEVGNNIAHGFIENGIAKAVDNKIRVKEVEKPKKDKQIRKRRRKTKLRTK